MQLPARFGKYELQEFLGGGMSHVYRALDTVIGRQVAVKILTEDACRNAEAKARFLQEARMSGTIQHDHIVTIHDYGEEQGRPYIVMEFLRGGDLRDSMRKGQAGGLANRLRIAAECAAAMEYVHSCGIIHRDLKPENIFLEESGRSKIMDFGISKAAGYTMTQTRNTMGTPHYMSPEQVTGATVTPLVDVYSFGVVLYELFTGERLVTGDSLERLFYAILQESPNPAKMAAAGVPPNLADLILRCTAKKPEERIQSFGAIRHVLLGLLEEVRGGGPAVGSGAKPSPGLRMVPIVAVGLGALAVGVAGIWLLTGPKKVEPPPVPPPAMPAMLDAKGGRMALIPAGPFLFGSSRTPVKLPAFYLDVTEVSNQAYREFATAVNHPLPNGFAADQPSLPVVNVTFTDAAAFCAWAGKRLPNEREWEKGARGGDGRNYPWGNDEVPGMANTNAKSVVAVNSFEAGASPYQLLHMTGNVLEWIDHPHTPSSAAVSSFATILQPAPTAIEAWHYAKGGAYDRPLKDGVTYEWMSLPARMVRDSIGFRCAQDPPEAK